MKVEPPVMFRPRLDLGADVLEPLAAAASNWRGRGSVRGLAMSAALARAAERAVPRPGSTAVRPARWTVDLSRPAALGEPCRVRAVVLRRGRRVCLVDAEAAQSGVVVARARGLFVAGGDAGSGRVWEPHRELPTPPAGLAAGSERRLYHSDAVGWTARAGDHRNADRKTIWQQPWVLVEDEEPSPFELVAGAADLVSMATQWGDRGLGSINADLDLHLVRLPVPGGAGVEVGVTAADRVESDGVAVGSTLFHDRQGVFGFGGVTALGNAQDVVVDPGWRDG